MPGLPQTLAQQGGTPGGLMAEPGVTGLDVLGEVPAAAQAQLQKSGLPKVPCRSPPGTLQTSSTAG